MIEVLIMFCNPNYRMWARGIHRPSLPSDALTLNCHFKFLSTDIKYGIHINSDL